MTIARHLFAWLCLMLVALPAQAQSSRASVNATVKASVLKPLVLTRLQDLDFGTIVLSPGSWSGAVVTISTTGTRTCSGSITCSGTATAARYNLTGSNNTPIRISAPSVVMSNAANPAQKLTVVLQAPATITLGNSGNAGTPFGVGGTITLSSATPTGIYTGTLEVTVDYQ